HFHSLPFPHLTAALSSQDLGSGEAGVAMEPAAQHRVTGKLGSLPGEVQEDSLGHILRTVRVAIHPSKCRRIYQIDIARNQLPKGCLRAVLSVINKQLLAVRHR